MKIKRQRRGKKEVEVCREIINDIHRLMRSLGYSVACHGMGEYEYFKNGRRSVTLTMVEDWDSEYRESIAPSLRYIRTLVKEYVREHAKGGINVSRLASHGPYSIRKFLGEDASYIQQI